MLYNGFMFQHDFSQYAVHWDVKSTTYILSPFENVTDISPLTQPARVHWGIDSESSLLCATVYVFKPKRKKTISQKILCTFLAWMRSAWYNTLIWHNLPIVNSQNPNETETKTIELTDLPFLCFLSCSPTWQVFQLISL